MFPLQPKGWSFHKTFYMKVVILFAIIVVYVISLICWWIYTYITLSKLFEEVTVSDVITNDNIMYVPIVNTIVFIFYILLDLNDCIKKLWNKFLNIKIKKKEC